MLKVAFVTCQVLPEPDVDEYLLVATCRSHGIEAECVAWDDESAKWSRYDLAVVRSSWNYYEREEAFRAWISRTDKVTKLWNPASLMLRTIHKKYLLELQLAGIPIVPTYFVDRASPLPVSCMFVESGVTKFVVKPAVSASSYMTRAFTTDQLTEAQDFLNEILRRCDGMVQEYIPSVAEGGEVAIVCIDGEITHAVTKNPRYHEGEESVSQGFEPSADQRLLAQRVLDTVPERHLYGRIDLMRLNSGDWVLSEAEFIEPSLYFIQHPPAVERFVEALKRIVN